MKGIHSRLSGWVFFILLAFGICGGSADAKGLGQVLSWKKAADGVVFECDGGIVKVSAHGCDIIRVRAVSGKEFEADESFAVIADAPRAWAPEVKITDSGFLLKTKSLDVKIEKDPFKVFFHDKDGNLINGDAEGIEILGDTVSCSKVMPRDEHYYGFGEKTGPLDKRGMKMEMWNSDAMYAGERDPLYQSHPFFVGLRKGTAYAIFFDNSFRSFFDMGASDPGSYSFSAEGGEMNYYFIYGPEIKKVIEGYTSLTGRMPLPPLWSLGYQQCRYSYKNEDRFRWLAKNFRERQIPCDVLYMDIHYMDDWKVFTFDKKRFPDPGGLISELGAEGFKVVTIIDPGIKVEPGYEPYDEGMAKGYFTLGENGLPFEARVWPRDCHWPDFTKPEVREWWGDLHEKYLEYGVAGIWNDMNEPAMWEKDIRILDLMAPIGKPDMYQMVHGYSDNPQPHAKIHNVYALLECQATYEGLLRLRPGYRPFIVTRAGYPGIWRYSSVWTGDNYSTWWHLATALPMHLNMGISGISFVGSDIGGFTLSPSRELFTRWIQQGVFYPFCRTHTAIHMARQEPWSYGSKVENISKAMIELRYQLLPYTYGLFEESARTGVPIKRAMVIEFPADEVVYDVHDQFMWGPSLLVAPVIEKGATTKSVYFPEGVWYRWGDDSIEQGPGRATVSAELDELPLYVKEGSIIPLAPVMNYIGEKPWDPLTLEVYPSPTTKAAYKLYEDDGETLAHKKGEYALTGYSCVVDSGVIFFEIESRRGKYNVPERDLILHFHGFNAGPGSVEYKRAGGKYESAARWTFDEQARVLEIKLRDEGQYLKIKIK